MKQGTKFLNQLAWFGLEIELLKWAGQKVNRPGHWLAVVKL